MSPPSLRQRLAFGLLALTLIVTGALAAAVWTGYLWLESSTLDRLLGRELDIMLSAELPPTQLGHASAGLTLYRPARVPAQPPPMELADLAPGSYRDFAIGSRHMHVLVRDAAPGDRVWLTYDVEAFERRETQILIWLAGGVLLAGLVAWMLSGWIARRTLQPLHSLVERIAALSAGGQQRLTAHADDGELSVIVSALNKRMAEIEHLVTRERAFAGAAAHELRTPLTSIRIAAETLSAQAPVPQEPVARIERAVAAASRELDTLLALSRGSDAPSPEPLHLHQLLSVLAEPYLLAAKENGTTVAWKLGAVEAVLPAGAFGIIFTNLLRNAIRAAPDGKVTVELDAKRLAVIDDGEGIPAAELEHVFEPGSHGRNGGTGIGLYISRALAERCGWALLLRSVEGKGTVAELMFSNGAA